ncbi:MAG: DUF975 family protein [Bacteroidales bacterium]|nr:DUF975 family protein [Bacteroidales bacterium]
MLSISNSELKDKALNDLKGNWTQPVLASLVYMVIAIIFSGDPSAFNSSNVGMQQNFTVWSGIRFLVSLFFIMPMSYSYMLLFLDFIRGEKEKIVGKMFGFFKDYGRSFGIMFMVYLYIFLWSLLLVIPGLIKALAYSMSYYISKDHPEYSIDECIEASKRMMDGHKWELFVLYLSFIGWILLSILTLGIGFLWLAPYMDTTIAHYYEELKAEQPAE